MAAKLPTILGGGILGVSIAGVAAGVIGLSFSIGAEVLSALLGMTATGVALRRRS